MNTNEETKVLNGEVLFTKVCEDKENVLHSPLLFQNNRLYIRSNGKFGYYEIKDNKILDYKEIM